MHSTINQILQKKYYNKKKNCVKTSILLEKRPQKSGVCLFSTVLSPIKPNSGSRHIAKLNIKMYKQKMHNFKLNKTYQSRTCWVALKGQSPNVTVYSKILFQGGGSPDVVGLHYKAVRGNRGFEGVKDRKTSRSKYGTKKK